MPPLLVILAAAALAAPASVLAQNAPATPMPGMAEHSAHDAMPAHPAAHPPPQPGASDPHPGHGAPDPAHPVQSGGAHQGMAHHGMEMGHMKGALGPYAMTRDASGTAWQPDSSPMEGIHGELGGWSTMLHGYATLVQDEQGGPRGDSFTFVESMLMGMAQRPVAGGVLTLRGMVSADPLMGKRGYPLLLQTGETANGRDLLIDRQHPHDLFMELAAVYSRPLSGKLNAFLYVAPVGEPALGPATFMHRFSGIANPEAPISHHWLDSTHITFGVVTGGLVYEGFKLEASRFTGREPNQNRYDLEHPRLDSWSVRGSWNPTPSWSLQVSRGHLTSPEQLEAEIDQDRTTASATYNRALAKGAWQTTLAWGRNEKQPGTTTDAVLLDSALSYGPHTVFGRAEQVDKDELFANEHTSPLHDRIFTVGKLSLGYAYTLPTPGPVAVDIGGLVSKYDLPSAIEPAYGSDPTSFMLFARARLR